MRITKGYIISILISAGSIALLVWAFMPQPVKVEIAEVKTGPFQASFKEDGKTRLRNRYTMSAPFSGTLLRPRLKVGDKVNQGDTIAVLYSAPSPLLDSRTKAELEERIGIADANREEASALLESARIQYLESTREFDRIKLLTDSGAATRQQLERAQLAKDVAERSQMAFEKRLHAAEHLLEQARQISNSFASTQRADQWTVSSPISGSVIKVYQESEGVIGAGSPLVDIGDLLDLEIVAEILTTDVVTIAPGQRVLITEWGGKTTLEGRVRLIEPAAMTKISALGIEEQRTPLVIDIISPSELWDRLGDQYRVLVTVITDEIDDALIVPTSALFHKDNNDFAFVVSGDTARLRQVQISRRSQGIAVIASGLDIGEKVILYPPRDLSDGVKVISQK